MREAGKGGRKVVLSGALVLGSTKELQPEVPEQKRWRRRLQSSDNIDLVQNEVLPPYWISRASFSLLPAFSFDRTRIPNRLTLTRS